MKLSQDEIDLELQIMRGWTLDGRQIKRTIHFETFTEAINFINKIAQEAERAGHHPDILIKYNNVTFTLTTHSENGLTEKDFALAKRIDEILGR
ncbi:MAG: 4a-hydroxytetrahydrobiopterin dehydratase [Candidatus Aenigmarchaeota archaeon]|nr:4a-hydroxytetrahydrobiopterin dehydratase [Candidatus Aenigmarchaeota archaeon]